MEGIILRKYLLTHHPALFAGQPKEVMRQHALGLEDLLERRVMGGDARDSLGVVRLDPASELRENVDSALEDWVDNGESGARWLRQLCFTSLQSYLGQRHPSVFATARSWQERRARTRDLAYASGLLAHKSQDFILYIGANDTASMRKIAGAIGIPQKKTEETFVLASAYLLASDIFSINSLSTRKQKVRELVLELEQEGALHSSGYVDKRYPASGRARYVKPNDPAAMTLFNEVLAQRGLSSNPHQARQEGLRPLREYLMGRYPHLYEDCSALTQLSVYSQFISVLEQGYHIPLQRCNRLRYIIRGDTTVETAIDNAIADLQLDGQFKKAKALTPEDTLPAKQFVLAKYGALFKEFAPTTRHQKTARLLDILEEKGLVLNGTHPRYLRKNPEDHAAIDTVIGELRLQGFFSCKKTLIPLRQQILECLPYLKEYPEETKSLEQEIVARAGHVLTSRNGAWYVKSKDALKYVKDLLV